MNKISILLALLTITLLAACSQHQQQPRHSGNSRQQSQEFELPTAERRLYVLKHKLNLTDEQVEAIRPIIEEDHDKKQELFAEFDPRDRDSMSEMRQKKEDLDWDTYKKLAEILTPEQMELYSKLLEEEEQEMKERMQSGGPGGGRGGPGGGRGGRGGRS